MNAETAFKFKQMCEQSQLILNLKIKEKETSAQRIENGTSAKVYKKPEKAKESEEINILKQKATDTSDKEEHHLETSMKTVEKPDATRRSHGYNLRRSKGTNECLTVICKKKATKKTLLKASSKVSLLASQLRMCLRSHTRFHGEKKKIN